LLIVAADIEWKPNASPASGIKDNASLIQIACENRIALFHIALFKEKTPDELLPAALKSILEDPKILKVGVAILSDCTRLNKYLGIEARGLIELSHLHKLVTYAATEPRLVNKHLVALARQVEQHLLLPLAKGPVRESDWSKELNYDQVSYAAADAYASFRLFDQLEFKRKNMKPVPPRPAFAELKLPILFSKGKSGKGKEVDAAVKMDELSDDDKAYETAPEDPLEDLEQESELLVRTLKEVENDLASIIGGTERLHLGDKTSRLPYHIAYPALPGMGDQSSHIENHRTGSTPVSGPSMQFSSTADPDAAEVERHQSTGQAPTCLEVQKAEAWAAEYVNMHAVGGTVKVTGTRLRAYHLWYHQSFETDRIASLLRDPPLKQATVSNYILDSIAWEKLPFDADRARVLLHSIPRHVAEKRYWHIQKKLEP
jgi:hypothetical protein